MFGLSRSERRSSIESRRGAIRRGSGRSCGSRSAASARHLGGSCERSACSTPPRADGDGDGYADIWRNEDDAFASIANYLRDAGWRPNLPWGVPVRVPATLNRAAIKSRINPPRCAAVYRRHSRWLTVAEWRALGVVPGRSTLPDQEIVTLMETPGAYAEGYLLTTNYRAILDYNCSNFYALGVGLLANAIAAR